MSENAQLEQIQLDFVPNEDRLLLKLRAGNQLYRAWLTRRFVRLLIPMLMGIRPDTGERFADTPALPPEEDAQLEPSSQPPLEQATPGHDTPLEYPLGETPILAVELSYLPSTAERPQAQLAIKPARGQGILLPYQPTINHMLLKLLRRTLQVTDWEQPLNWETLAAPSDRRLQ
ncbi:hypothetical protein [Sulfurivirga sp.]|uniref:hypothetical protein n=1 Tax=Sulfurivirga sp. TaxID=2614236 RepID=UPI0025EB034F|nr:hypothetical protein [Sulfurivirga sp.]